MNDRKLSKICQKCGSDAIAKIIYGMIDLDDKLKNDENNGKIILGGCVIMPNAPKYHCNDCSYEWNNILINKDIY